MTAIRDLGLKDTDRRKIDRYLNSTRAALLFARDVVLVEGIAEMLVLPALAQHHLRLVAAQLCTSDDGQSADGSSAKSSGAADAGPAAAGDAKSSGSKGEAGAMTKKLMRQFRSATLISIEGVDFEPYLRVLLDGEHPRIDRVVVVTDRDHNGAGDERRTLYEERFARHIEGGRLTVVVGGTTLEAEMFRMPENEKSLHKAFLKLHPKSQAHWANVVAKVDGKGADERAETFAAAIRAKSPTEDVYLDIAKGDFAHIVAEALESDDGSSLEVPTYLKDAIDAVAHVDAERE